MNAENCGNISDMFSSEVITKDLAELSPIIYNVLETAQAVVPDCIELFRKRCASEKGIPERVYKWLYPSLIRAIVQVLLHSQNVKTQILFDKDGNVNDLIDWDCVILSNNGLAGVFTGYNYRILKAISEKLPPPGISQTKQSYYCQDHLKQTRLKLFPYDYSNNMQKPNVIYLWSGYNNSPISLHLSCPKSGTLSTADDYFTVPIEHPVLAISNVNAQDIVEDIPIEKLIPEFNISLKDEEEHASRE